MVLVRGGNSWLGKEVNGGLFSFRFADRFGTYYFTKQLNKVICFKKYGAFKCVLFLFTCVSNSILKTDKNRQPPPQAVMHIKQHNHCYSLEWQNSCCGIWALCVLSSRCSMGHYGPRSPQTVLQCFQHQKWDGASWDNILSVPVWFVVFPLSLCLKYSTSSLCVCGKKKKCAFLLPNWTFT